MGNSHKPSYVTLVHGSWQILLAGSAKELFVGNVVDVFSSSGLLSSQAFIE